MYPSRDLNPIAIEHMQRSRLLAYERFVDSGTACPGRWRAGLWRMVVSRWRGWVGMG